MFRWRQVFIALVLLHLGAPQITQAQDKSTLFKIPSQSLGESLEDFADQSGIQLLYRADILADAVANAVEGRLAPSEALTLLLGASGIRFRWVNSRTIALTQAREKVTGSGTAPRSTAINLPDQDGVKQESVEYDLPADAADNESPIFEMIVTGTRIPRSSMVTTTPISILDNVRIEFSGATNMIDLVNELPQIGPGLTNSNTNFSFTSAGLNVLNLRNLGTKRTLVLIDGRRHVGSLPGTTAVDMGAIPTALVDRVEVITGGASPIYGSDAVSGVVNFIMKRDFEGLQVEGQIGLANENQEQEYSLSVTFGSKFADERGNIVANFSFSDVEGISAKDRKFAIAAIEFLPNPDNTGPNDGIPDLIAISDVHNVFATTSGAISLPVNPVTLTREEGAENLFTFGPNGSLRPFDFGDGLALEGRHVGDGDGDIISLRDLLRVPLQRHLSTLYATYEISNGVELFIDAKFVQIKSEAKFQPVFDLASFAEAGGPGITLSSDNPFIQNDLRAILLGDPNDPTDDIEEITVSRTNVEFGDRGQKVNRRTFRSVLGMQGGLSEDWTYQAYYQYGRTRSSIIKKNDRLQARFEQSLDATINPDSGEIVCRDPANACAAFNPLGPTGTASSASVEFSRIDTVFRDVLTQQVAHIEFAGSLGNLSAGSVGAAIGAEYRKETSESMPPEESRSGLGFFNTRLSPVKGSYDVKEVFAELLVPILRDNFLAKELTLEMAVRSADYKASGHATSWRLSGRWAPNAGMTVRVAFARAIRAPNIGELFQPETEGFPRVEDPCDAVFLGNNPNRAENCAALGVARGFTQKNPEIGQRTISIGNPELAVEKAKTLTFGVILRPALVPGLSIALDSWDVKINDAISSFPVQSILDNCVDAPSIFNQFCRSIVRDADGNIQTVTAQAINLSRIESSGIDLDINYVGKLGGRAMLGDIRLGFVGTYLRKLDFFLPPDVVDRQAGEIGIPKWRFRSNADYLYGPFTFSVSTRFIGSTVRDILETEERRFPFRTGTEWYFDSQSRFKIGDKYTLIFGINNIFNNAPPLHPDTFQGGTGLNPNAILYDSVGRFFYLGANARF